MPKTLPNWSSPGTKTSGWKTAFATTTEGERKKRTHRLITRGAAVESVAPEVRELSERAFYLLMEQVFSLPEVAALVSNATGQQADG